MNYRRPLLKQYGGNSYEERSTNTYISTNSFKNISTSNVFKVFGGDTYCNYFGYQYIQAQDETPDVERAIYFVVESPFNVDLRHGVYFNDTDPTTYSEENYEINDVYLQENNLIQYFKAKPFNVDFEDEQPYAIWVSEKKQNGEKLDSWLNFLPNNQIEVDGIHGSINTITSFKDRLYFYQNHAIGLLPIEQQSITTDQNGVELVLGSGDVISQYGYISTTIGAFHHDAVIQSEDYIYNFDIKTKKLWRFTPGSKEPLSDLKGLSAYFYNNLYSSSIENRDKKTSLYPAGIHGAYDSRYNRVLFTFNGSNNSAFTISFNELLNSFESFYSYTPTVYLSTQRKVFSIPSTDIRNTLYQHDLGDYGVYYENLPEDSKITYLINGQDPSTKRWDNLEWYSQCFNNLNVDQPNETFELISISNDHQSTGSLNIQETQGRRRFRYWRYTIPRDINSPQQEARIRNPWIFVELTKLNNNNTRFIMNDLNTYYNK
jgi:hypothetical protein